MNTELQQLRTHYEGLSQPIKARKTAQSLLRAIQIAESRYSANEIVAVGFGDLGLDVLDSIKKRRADSACVTQKEGQ